MRRLYVCSIITASFALQACSQSIAYDYDLLKFEVLYVEGKSGINIDVNASEKVRFFGAVVKNGAPFSLGLTVDHSKINPNELKASEIQVIEVASKNVISNVKLQEMEWHNRGVLSVLHPSPIFEFNPNLYNEFCVVVNFYRGAAEEPIFEKRCYRVFHKVGVGEMTINDILNQ